MPRPHESFQIFRESECFHVENALRQHEEHNLEFMYQCYFRGHDSKYRSLPSRAINCSLAS